MSFTVFYAWQSDRDQKTTRFFVRDCLAEAIKQVNNEYELDEAPRTRQHRVTLDHDTKNVPGTPAIADTIAQKIKQCGVFVADLTYVAKAQHQPKADAKAIIKYLPNSNVLFELGLAASAPGWPHVICVMNTSHGAAKKLPFDFRHRTFPIQYELKTWDDPNRAKIKKDLIASFVAGIGEIIASGVLNDIPGTKIEVVGPDAYFEANAAYPKGTGVVELTIHNLGDDIYDMKVCLEVDCRVPDPASMDRPKDEWTLKKGYHGLVSIHLLPQTPMPNPFRKGQSVKLKVESQSIKKTVDFGCNCERLKDMDLKRISIVVKAAGDRVIRRVPGVTFKDKLAWMDVST